MAAAEGEIDPSCSLTFDEASFTALPSQTNIYGMSRIESENNCNKVLLASLRGSVVCVEYPDQSLQPRAREVPFTYIPDLTEIPTNGDCKKEIFVHLDTRARFLSSSIKHTLCKKPTHQFFRKVHEVFETIKKDDFGDAEIVSIDAFIRKSEKTEGIVVGISLILLKNAPHRQEQFLNIYSAVEPGNEFSLDSIAQGCQHIKLNFVPFQLKHTEIKVNGTRETVFLLSGSDNCVHMFCEDKSRQRFEEHPVTNAFPELQDLPNNVLWLDIEHLGDDKRLTALGCQNGYVRVAVVDIYEEPNIVYESSIEHDGPISSVRLFSPTSCVHSFPESLKGTAHERLDGDCKGVEPQEKTETREFHLLVSCTIEPCVVYVNVVNQGLTSLVTLPDSDRYDCVVCSCIADVDWDGINEIVLGTYGQELLVFKSYKLDTMTVPAAHPKLEFKLLWQRSFATPLFSLEYTDLTNDGLREMVVATLSGLHILQHNLEQAADTCAERIKKIQLT